MPGTWKPLGHQPPVAIDTMLLLTDGSVMCHDLLAPDWYRLTPDAFMDYANGSWHKLTPMPANAPPGQNGPLDAPLYYASAVLRDGRVFVAGGEYNVDGGTGVDLLAAEIYDPVADSWTSIATPPGWTNIGDAPSGVLPDGRVLLGNINTAQTAILDPVTRSWSAGGNKHDTSSEESWTLLPDGTIIVAEVNNHPHAEKYLIASNHWIQAGSTPPGHDLVLNEPGVSIEIGPAILMPDGRVFCAGATGHTALYLPPLHPTQPGTWIPGPDFPPSGGQLMRAFDAPASLLPNGSVLCAVGPLNAGWSGPPTEFFEFDGAVLHAAPNPASAAGVATYDGRLLLLPSGQVLYSNCTNTIEIYTPSGGPQPAWRPHITDVPRHLRPGETYRLHGRQLNGLSQAVAYGDDAQMATNYPLVRLLGPPGVGIVFCRTFDHSTMAVATGTTIHHTHFAVPMHLQHGAYELVVIANGIASEPVEVHVGAEEEAHEHHEHGPDRREPIGHDREGEREEDDGSLSLRLNVPIRIARR
jgi:Kelch motif